MKENEGRSNKPIYKKWWFWVIIVIIVGGIGGALDGDKETAAPASTETSAPADELGGVPEETADSTPEPAAPAEEPEEETPVEEPAVEAPAEEPVAEPATEPAIAGDWRAEIEKIASSSDAAPDKASAAEALAMDYAPNDDELKEFESYIVSEFKSGNYLTGLSDDNYALMNIFQALTVQQHYKNLNESAIGDFAFDFYQNSKYVYRGVDAPDSDAVKSNEEQMEKSLAKMQ